MATSPRTVTSDPVSVRPIQLEQVEHLLKLQKWAQKITSILDLDVLIDQVVNDVACDFGCVEANLYLHDEVHGELEAAGVHGCTTIAQRPSEFGVVLKSALCAGSSKNRQNIERGSCRRAPRHFQGRLLGGEDDIMGPRR